MPPVGKNDKWMNSLLSSGWMARAHGGRRHRLFHPLHKGCPWDQFDMEKRRITVVFSSTGKRFVLHDEWDGLVKNPGCLSEGEAWTGWTFFQRRTSSTAPAPVPYAAGAMAGAPSTTSSATASDAQEVVIAADTPQSTMVEVGRQDQLEVTSPISGCTPLTTSFGIWWESFGKAYAKRASSCILQLRELESKGECGCGSNLLHLLAVFKKILYVADMQC